MRAVGVRRIAGGIVLIALVAAPGSAASEATGRFPLIAEFELRGSNGYRVHGFAIGNVAAIEARSGRVSAQYVVEGRRTGRRFTARFGRLGRLALEFHPAGGGSRRSCELLRRGIYRGAIDFSGERDYTEVHARAAKGFALAIPQGCGASSSATRPYAILTHLHAVAKRPRGAAALSVLRLARGRALAFASLEERKGRMSVTRNAFALIGGRRAFIVSGPDKHPAFAFLKPPKPFAGSAVYEESGVAASEWTGDLTAWMPGAGRVPLAGLEFSSNLCRRRAGEPGCGLEPTVRRPLSVLRGGGLQSQLLTP